MRCVLLWWHPAARWNQANPCCLAVEQVLVPKDLAPGHYVVGWRWDCVRSATPSPPQPPFAAPTPLFL
jgi:hypothetical protein